MQNCKTEDRIHGVNTHRIIGHYILDKLTKFRERLSRWQHNRRTRYYLAEMPDHLLKDIGMTESERQEEITKKFWQK
ncbi:DUF1127 domain-containing protein [Tolumonas lignilytica]|uniref:DUF1127 domain-containing protein n=1 Tax=Tolumonas lignilytica TaxID=1283284 RepID=UPI000464D526|nr:DUF1127 domain-containing protein [Tolumonas lignilytica]